MIKDYTMKMKAIVLLFAIWAVHGSVSLPGGFEEIDLDHASAEDRNAIDKYLNVTTIKLNEVKTQHGSNNEEPLKIVRLLNAPRQVKVCTLSVTNLHPWENGGTWLVLTESDADPCKRFLPNDTPKQSLPVLGGEQKVDTNDVLTQQAAQWAVEHINKMSNSLFMQSLKTVAHATRQEARRAALDTAKMDAQAGRASYVNKTLLTKPDPGAVALAGWFKAATDIL